MTDRLFVAVWPDAAARQALRISIDGARPTLPDIRWQPEERWHVTLAFLGSADRAKAEGRLDLLPLPRAEPIRLRGAGRFGPIVWIGVEHGQWLDDLAHGIQRALHVPDRRFQAHMTVGRARGAAAIRLASEARGGLSAHEGPPWTPEAITLVESQTGPQPRYTVRARWTLALQDDATGTPTGPDDGSGNPLMARRRFPDRVARGPTSGTS